MHAELPLGQRAGQVAIGRHAHDGAGHLPRQHQRLVAGRSTVASIARAVGHDDHAVGGVGAPVAAAQDRRPLAARDQPLGEGRHDRRLAGAADREIADADHRTQQAALPLRLALHAPAPHAHHLAVEGIKQGV